MSFAYSPYILPLLAAALISATVAVYAWMRRSATGASALLLMAVSILVWAVGYSLEIAGTDIETKYFWGVMQYIGIAYAPYGWLIFSIAYSDLQKIISRRFVILTVFIPSLTILLALTTKWHGLIWSEYHINYQDNFSAIAASYGLWFWVHFAYSYIILLIGTILLARTLLRRQGMYRGQIASMLIAVLVPWINNILYFTGNSPIPYLDPTPFAFTVTVAALAWATFGFHLVDITPLARDRVVDSMREGMIVLNVRGNIVDINNAAARMIGVPVANAIGKIAGDVFSPWSHLVERFRSVLEARDEISVGEGAAQRRYEVRLSPLQDPQGQLVGRVIMLRAMDDDAPQPRLIYNTSADAAAQPLPRATDEEDEQNSPPTEKKTTSIWDEVIGYFFVQIKKDIPIPVGVNPVWHRTRERIFTVGARIVSSIGLISLIFAPRSLFSTSISLIFAVLLAFLFLLGAARTVKYELRITGFLALVYGFAFMETLNFGFSVESFTFFLGFVIIASVLTSRRAAISALAATIVSLSVFAVLIDSGTFIPLMKRLDGIYVPEAGFSSLLVLIATASATTAFIVILLENLNVAWQKEEQVSNLLRQERDLLEQHVEQRTHDLEDARDSAIRGNHELRKYYRAIEQSGNSIVITDINGNIEYANPKFEEVTGYSLEEALGKNPRILKSGRQKIEVYENLWATIGSGQVWQGIFNNKKKDGSLYWESATIAPVMDQNGAITNYVAIKEDITARRQVEEQLQKLSRAVEQSGNTVIVMDKNGLIEYVNPKFTEVTGYFSEEALGKSPISLMNGLNGVPDFSQDEWWLTVNAGQIWHGEFQNHRKDGSMFWESATIAPVLNRDGEVINFVEIKQDITEQKILQDQLQKQNDYLSILHQMTLDLLNRRNINDLLQVIVERSAILLDSPYSELRLLENNELVAHAVTGNAQKLKGERVTREKSSLTWQAVDTRQYVTVDDYSTWSGKRADYEEYSPRAIVVFPILAGDRCLGVLSVVRDQPNYKFSLEQIETGISFSRLVALVLDNANLYQSALNEIAERKRTEALLQESEARFRQIVENASDIIYRSDINGNFTYANPAALKMIGYDSEQEVLGKNYVDLTTPEFRHKLKRVYDHQYISKTKSTYYEFPAVTVNGEIVWVGQNVQLIMDGEQVIGFQSVARNITQLKQAQEALALSRDQALDASRFKSQLLSRVSHELRTPLGGILGYAELLEYKAFGSLTADQQNAVSNIIESTNYLTSIVNDLLDESQIESKSISLHNEYFSPADLVEKTKSTMSTLAVKKGLAFSAEIDPELPGELYGDVNRLQQILINLEGNAIKFTKTGEVTVRLKRPTPAQWSIEVRDTGAGIPLEDRQNIFEPFRQVSNSITRENRGSGLGLAITKQLIELMGGQISLQSEVGKGSLFVVTLPITNAPGE